MNQGEDRQDSMEVEEDKIRRWWEAGEDNKGWDMVDGSEAQQGRVHHGVMEGHKKEGWDTVGERGAGTEGVGHKG